MAIWFVRHAESEANAGKATSDPAQISLTSQGREQAKEVANKIDFTPDLIVHSAYVRTYETAKPTIDKNPNSNVEQWNVQEMTYLAPERCQNMTFEGRKPMVEAFWTRNDPDYVDGVGAESFNQFLGRVDDLLAKLSLISEDKNIVIFTHEMFLRALVMKTQHMDLTMQSFKNSSIRFKNTEIFALTK